MAALRRPCLAFLALWLSCALYGPCTARRPPRKPKNVTIAWDLPYSLKNQKVTITKGQFVVLKWASMRLFHNVYRFPNNNTFTRCTFPKNVPASRFNATGARAGSFAIPWVKKGFVAYYGCTVTGEVNVKGGGSHCSLANQKIAVVSA